MFLLRASSSVDQSLRLRTARSGVQVSPSPPVRRRGSSVDQSAALRKLWAGVRVSPAPPIFFTWVGSQVGWQRAFNPLIASSILARPTSRAKKHGLVAQMAEHPVLTRDVGGLSPSGLIGFVVQQDKNTALLKQTLPVRVRSGSFGQSLNE